MNMKTSLLTLGAVGMLTAGVAIHHTGHCPLMEARAAMMHHATPVSGAPATKVASAVKPNTVVLTSVADAAR